MDLPQTLYGQLYLLAYDRRRRRFDFRKLWLLGYALRGAILTELLLTGYLRDTDGMARRTGRVPVDPVLRTAVETIDDDGPRPWSLLVVIDQQDTYGLVRQQLEHHGWVGPQLRHRIGVIPTFRFGVTDEDAAASLADRAIQAIRSAVADRPAEPRALTLGLLAVLGELPLLSNEEVMRNSDKLRALVLTAFTPIIGMHQAVEAVHAELEAPQQQQQLWVRRVRRRLRGLWRLRWLGGATAGWHEWTPPWRRSSSPRPCSRLASGSHGNSSRRGCGSGCAAALPHSDTAG